MQITLKEYKKQPNVAEKEEWQQIVNYILGVANNEDYEEAVDYIAKNYLRDPDEKVQVAALQGLGILSLRFGDTNDEIVLPLLFENLNSPGTRVRYSSFDLLNDIEHLIPRLKQTIYNSFFGIAQ